MLMRCAVLYCRQGKVTDAMLSVPKPLFILTGKSRSSSGREHHFETLAQHNTQRSAGACKVVLFDAAAGAALLLLKSSTG
jgi:hypothetical protein